MRGQWKGFVMGVVSCVLILGLCNTAFASTVRQLNATYNDIKIKLNGDVITPKDAGGNTVEPFIVNGTTYLPIRAIAEALGLTVDWDGTTQTVIMSASSTAQSSTQPSTVKPPEQTAPSDTQPQRNQGESYRITYQNCRLEESLIGTASQYESIVEIENDGSVDLYLKDATFDFEDRSGHLLETKSFVSADPEIIAPGEKGYFYSSGSLDNVTASTDYVFKPVLKVEKSKKPIIRYAISDTSKEITQYDQLKITGRVQNNTSEDDSMIWVALILYRYDGTPIVAGGTNVLDVKAGETVSFSRSFSKSELGIPASEVARFEAYACKMQYQF